MNNAALIKQLRRANTRHCLDVIEEAATSLESADKRIAELEARTPAAPVVAEGLAQYEQNVLESCANWLQTRSAAFWAKDGAHDVLMRGYAADLRAILAAHPVAGSPAEAEPVGMPDLSDDMLSVDQMRRNVRERKQERMVIEMVNRFLGWPLPHSFAPDCGISFDGRKDDEWNKNKSWPIGTNLLTADEAKAMFEYCFGTRAAAEPMPASEAPAEKPHDLTIGEAFEQVGGYWTGGDLGYPTFGSTEALKVYTAKMIRSYLANKEWRESTATPVPASEAASQQADQAHVMPLFAAPASQHGSWIAADEKLPEVPADDNKQFIIACRRANGKTYVFAADYLNAKELSNDDDGHAPVTGWYLEGTHPDYNGWFEPVCQIGDVVTHWTHLPPAPEQSSIAGSAKGGITNDSTTILAAPAAPTDAKADAEPVAEVNSSNGCTSTSWLKKLPDGVHRLYLANPAAQSVRDALEKTELDGWNAAAKALAERAAGHFRMENYELQDECLQCASMLHDLKPVTAIRALIQSPQDGGPK